MKYFKTFSILLLVVFALIAVLYVGAQGPVLDKFVYIPFAVKADGTPTPIPTETPKPTLMPTITPTPAPQWVLFLTGYDDRKMTGLPTGSVRRSSLTDYWGNVVYPNGVFIVLFMNVVNCELMSGHVSGINTFWMRDGSGPFFDMADLDAQFAAEDEYNRMGVYEDLQPQFVYEMVFVFDVPPQGSYSLWYIPWGSVSAAKAEYVMRE